MTAEQYEKVSCNYCGSASSQVVFDYGATAIVRCTNCGLVYANPRVVEQVMLETYRNPAYFRESLQVSDDSPSRRRTLHDVMLGIILDKIGAPPTGGRLLDLGCGIGVFMHHARRRGWQVEGWELSPFAAEFASKELGLNVRTGPMELSRIENELFDVVGLIDVLDHVYDPMATLSHAHRILKPGGRMVLTMLNFAGLSTRLFRARNYVLDTSDLGPGHLTFFTPTTLRAFLKQAGFDHAVVWVGEVYLKNFTALFQRWLAPRCLATELHKKARGVLRAKWWTIALYRLANSILALTGLGDQITAIVSKSASCNR